MSIPLLILIIIRDPDDDMGQAFATIREDVGSLWRIDTVQLGEHWLADAAELERYERGNR